MSGPDPIAAILDQWNRERPELDTSGFAVTGRVLVLAKLLERRVADALAPHDLTQWAFDVLATLRRQGEPFRLTPTELSRATMLTTGAMTNRLDRLESAGLVARSADPGDRRGVIVSLTPAGRERVDRALESRMQEASEAVEGLSDSARRALEKHLGALLRALGSR